MTRNIHAARRIVGWSGCAAIALAATTAARAANEEQASTNFADGLSLNRPVYMADQPVSDGLLQSQMRERGMGGSWLAQNDIRLTGYAEAGVNFNFDRPLRGANGTGRLFDDKSEDPKLHQISLRLTRDPIVSADRFDTGFDVQVIYGADARYTQANGTNFYGSNYAQQRNFTFLLFQNGTLSPVVDERGFPGQEFPENQIDLLQANVSFNLPFGNGVLLKAGKFVAPWGIEQIDPTKNLLYSHSYIFALSTPRTLTGVTAKYRLNDEWEVMGGLVTGWNQSIEDNNSFPSVLAQGTWHYSDEWTFVLTGIIGPEQRDDRSDYRYMIDATADWKVSQEVHVGAESVFGYELDSGTSRDKKFFTTEALRVTGDDALWFGVAGYVSNRFDDAGMWTGVARIEYFNDSKGAFVLGTEVFALSGGLIIKPFPNDEVGRNLMIRPEIRWDLANDAIFDTGRGGSQITLGADVVFSF